MNSTEQGQRRRVVTEAYGWLHTPYHHNQRLKGAGVDCANLPAAVYAAAGAIPDVVPEEYSPQWHIHRDDERYLGRVVDLAREITTAPQPGDFVLWKVGRCYAHGAIVIDWPLVIHAVAEQGVVMGNAERDTFAKKLLKDREPRFFTLWGAD